VPIVAVWSEAEGCGISWTAKIVLVGQVTRHHFARFNNYSIPSIRPMKLPNYTKDSRQQ